MSPRSIERRCRQHNLRAPALYEGWDETDPCIHGLVEDAWQSARFVSRVRRLRAERLRSKQTEALSRRDRLEPCVHMQLGKKAPQVVADRLGRDGQLRRDLGCR